MILADAKQVVIEKWRNTASPDFVYFDEAEKSVTAFWNEGSHFRREFEQLDLTAVVEIACGKGRHAAQLIGGAGRLHLVDTSEAALAAVRERFRDRADVSVHLSPDGETLAGIADESVTAVFSYDAMVHFEPMTVAAYLREIRRVLAPGGRALLHPSNYAAAPDQPFDVCPGWRNYMTSDLFRHSFTALTFNCSVTPSWTGPALIPTPCRCSPVLEYREHGDGAG